MCVCLRVWRVQNSLAGLPNSWISKRCTVPLTDSKCKATPVNWLPQIGPYGALFSIQKSLYAGRMNKTYSEKDAERTLRSKYVKYIISHPLHFLVMLIRMNIRGLYYKYDCTYSIYCVGMSNVSQHLLLVYSTDTGCYYLEITTIFEGFFIHPESEQSTSPKNESCQ